MLRTTFAIASLALLFACNSSTDGNGGGGMSSDDDGAGAGGTMGTGGGATTGTGGMGTGGEIPMGPPSTQQSLDQQAAMYGWGANMCPAPPAGVSVGYGVGDQIDSLVLKDCDGNDVSLEEVCGADATWLFFAHGWCPHCKLASSLMEGIRDDYAGQSFAAINVVVETASGEPPTETHCQVWRNTYGQEDVLTLYDPTGASFILWEENFTALNVFIDGDRVIDQKVHTDQESTLYSAIDSLLP